MNTKTYPGLFVAIEGADGSGKTTVQKTLIELFKTHLEGFGVEVVPTREPGGSVVADVLRGLITGRDEASKLDPLHPGTTLLLVLASRMQHTHATIYPNVLKGNVVISDRCFDSTWVYQGMKANQAHSLEIIENLKDFSVIGQRPDYTFFLDVSPEVSMQRTGDRIDKGEAFNESGGLEERSADIQRYRRRMTKASEQARGTDSSVLWIDANQSLDEITAKLQEMVAAICTLFILKRETHKRL